MKECVINYYDKNSDNRYEKRGTMDDVIDSYVDILDDFIQLLPKPKQVLDCGCGVGRDMRYMAEHGIYPIGIDISREQLQYATQPAIQSDMSSLCFHENSFSGLWVPNSIFYLPKEDIAPTLTEFRRILTDNGVLALGFKVREETQQRTMERFDIEVPYVAFSPIDARNIIQQAGFSITNKYSNEIDENRTFLTFFCELEEME